MTRFKRYSIYILLSLCIFIQDPDTFAQENISSSAIDTTLFPFDFFDIDEPLQLTLKFDIKKFKKQKPEDVYLPAELTYFVDNGLEIKKMVRVKTRGEFRRNHCLFSPYWLNIKGANIVDDHISNVNKVKIVTHCKESTPYSNYLLKEFIVYKLYNIISDHSFKARLLKIKYVDTGRNNKITENWAFMIEPEDMLAKRLEAYPLKMDKVRYSLTDSITTSVMSMFQYMIGNTDYSVAGRHNVKLLTLKDYAKPELKVIPYDFDFSGLVNAFYAMPSENTGMVSVTMRYYYGMCRSDETYNYVLGIFKDKEDEIFSYIESFEHMDKKTRNYVLKYIRSFYKEIEKPKFINNRVRITCE